ncbi:MAG: hypothetical protein OEV87_10195 [Phycisphaerae bacterium]|nr:hypothetical protein [Phycisphaerae bacterium]
MKPEEIVEKYCFYQLAEGDLILSKSFLKAIDENTEKKITNALIQCTILSYCRPFKECRGVYRKYRLSKKFIPNNLKQIHQEMIHYRDKVFAHTDVELRNPKLIRWEGKSGYVYPMQFKGLSPAIFEKNIPNIISSIESVQSAIAREIKEMKPFLDEIE